MQTNDYTKKAKLYALAKITETGYLAYRDILRFIPNELKKGKTLDFGCGSGRSTRFLRALNRHTPPLCSHMTLRFV
ncbi:hypothetical protein ACR9PT_12875 [Piscirickettsia salmonis]|uniref:hypothetical protein n=1 Tax=Piscirickettsia salmonis TaxID=1238 RepID=UPI003EBBE9CD